MQLTGYPQFIEILTTHRAGLTIEQTGQMPGASRFWRPRA